MHELAAVGPSLVIVLVGITPIIGTVVVRACERTSTPRKALASDLRISESQLSHIIAGAKNTHFPEERLPFTSPAFRAAFVEELASVLGVTELLVTARDVLAVLRARHQDADARRLA